jgi:hypothetical protein
MLLKVAIAVLAFGLGVYVDALWRAYVFSDAAAFNRAQVQPSLVNSEAITVAAAIHSSGPSGNTHIYELSDGGHVLITCEFYTSPSAANQELHSRAVGRTDMLEWSENVDGDGESVGQKIVFMTPTVVSFSTSRSYLCETKASSVKHLHLIEDSPR